MRKLLLLSTMALAAMALAAPNAFAQEDPVEVVNEATGAHCDYAAGNCIVHAESDTNSIIVQHIFGHEEQSSSCHDSFEARLDEDGTGEIYNQHLEGPECEVAPCTSSATEEHWPIHQAGETGPGTGHMEVEFCLVSELAGEIHCHAPDVQITEAPGHEYEFRVTDLECEVIAGIASATINGHWLLENGTHDSIEIVHAAA